MSSFKVVSKRSHRSLWNLRKCMVTFMIRNEKINVNEVGKIIVYRTETLKKGERDDLQLILISHLVMPYHVPIYYWSFKLSSTSIQFTFKYLSTLHWHFSLAQFSLAQSALVLPRFICFLGRVNSQCDALTQRLFQFLMQHLWNEKQNSVKTINI